MATFDRRITVQRARSGLAFYASSWLIALAFGVSGGCAIGPKVLMTSRQKYNEAVTRTDREELLLNIVRCRYTDSIGLLSIGSIATQHAWDYSANASGGVGREASDVLNLAGRTDFSERPTVSYSLPEHDVVRGFLNPLDTQALFVLAYTGSPTHDVFSIIAKSVNQVENAISAGGPIPRTAPEFAEFRWLVQNLRALGSRRQLEVGRLQRLVPISDPVPRDSLDVDAFRTAFENDYQYEPTGDGNSVVLHKKEMATFLRFAPEALSSPEYLEIVRILQLQPGLTKYELKLALEGQLLEKPMPPEGRTEILISIRSLLEIMHYLALGVDVPPSHVRKGWAQITIDGDGCPFDWQQVLGNRFHVYVAKKRPLRSAVAVKYRHHWFYIDDRDQASKSTLVLLRKIFALEVQAGGSEALPVLTLPIGG